jgi:putative FmdB family regulatory protein
MPFYEYECSSCKFYSEVMQKITDAPLRKCPSCGKNTLRKLLSAPVFRLKGGGWYETDFKSDQESKRNLAAADKDAAEKEPAKTDAKPQTPAKAEGESKAAADKTSESKAGAPRRRPGKVVRRSKSTKARPRSRARTTRKARR